MEYFFYGRSQKLEGVTNNQGPEQQKGGKSRKGQRNDDLEKTYNKEKENQQKHCHVDGQQKKEGYFANYEGEKMTIVFHAVLTPHFKFDKSQGDRIFMRFGGVVFGNFNEDVVEVHPER